MGLLLLLHRDRTLCRLHGARNGAPHEIARGHAVVKLRSGSDDEPPMPFRATAATTAAGVRVAPAATVATAPVNGSMRSNVEPLPDGRRLRPIRCSCTACVLV